MLKTKDQIKILLERNVVDVVDRESLEKKLKNKKLRIKLGIDPTGANLHLGRAIALRKLKNFQDLGHQIVLIIGDFTSLIGDASDKESRRPKLTKEQIGENMKNYRSQIGKILDVEKTEFRYNSEWLGKLNFEELLQLASLFTVQQLINRRNFKERFDGGNPIGFEEFMYPLMQGYDSVAVSADLELGGTDQLFNLMAGRKAQEFFGQPPQDIMTLEMLEGLDGRKMSTSYGNVINLTDEPDDMFGKVMSLKDELLIKYFLLATDANTEKVEEYKRELDNDQINPFELKKILGFELVKLYHGFNAAENARDNFTKTFQNKEKPDRLDVFTVSSGKEFKDILIENGFVPSNQEFRRLIKAGGIDFDGRVIDDVRYKIEKSGVFRIGKKKFFEVRID